MKIFERILDRRIRDITQLTVNQCDFVKDCGTIDVIYAARFLLEKQKALHIAFLDLEKAFDRVSHEVIWYALRCHEVLEEFVQWVKILYVGLMSRVRTTADGSEEFSITVGVHQGSVLSLLFFILVMDAVIGGLQKPVH